MQIAKKGDITVLDMFYNKPLNSIDKELYGVYMVDPVHPRRAGYKEWWVPEFEKCIKSVL